MCTVSRRPFGKCPGPWLSGWMTDWYQLVLVRISISIHMITTTNYYYYYYYFYYY